MVEHPHYIVPDPLIASFWFQARGKESVLSPRPPGASSDRRRLNLCGPRWPEEAGLDRLLLVGA